MPGPINNRKDLLGFPQSYAFVIGINHYPEISRDLSSAGNDARALAQVLKHRQGFDHVELVLAPKPEEELDELKQDLDGIIVHWEASTATLRDLLARIKDPEQEPRIDKKDCIVFYYAGHGVAGEFDQGPAGYILPSDTKPGNSSFENETLIPMEDVFDALKDLDCHHTLLILDCCFAGKFRYIGQNTRASGWVKRAPMYEERFERFKRERAWQVLVSAGPHQTAADWLGNRLEESDKPHSPFAEALLDALEGKAETKERGKNLGDGVLTSQELYLYLWNKVEQWSNDDSVGRQIQYPDLFPMSNHQGGQFIFFDPNNRINFANRVIRNPYKGLSPFEPGDSDLFFGRKNVIPKLVEKVLSPNLLLVTAPSGGGKSSVVRAGLYPALQQEEAWKDAPLLEMRPGALPHQSLQELLPKIDPTKKQLLLIDQYEELFTECADEDERQAFEQEMIRLYRESEKAEGMKIVLTMRSDFEWQLEVSEFGKEFWDAENLYTFMYRLPPMGLDELREALINPAWVEAYDFESDELVDFILEEVSYAPGALPLLSFTLSELYRIADKDERIFTYEQYKTQLGGVNGALSKRARAIYDELPDDEHRHTMQKIMLRMVRLNDGSFSRRRVYMSPTSDNQDLHELNFPGEEDKIVGHVLRILEEAHLIIRGRDAKGQAYIEPVHDSLINYWPLCRQWIDDFGRDHLLLQRQLWQAVIDSAQPQAPGMSYGATPEDDLPGSDGDFKADFSKLWEHNPKLMQVIDQIAEGATEYMFREKEAILAEAREHLSEEDYENFAAFWEDCHAKKEVPDLNSLVLSGYSDELLHLFIDNGQHWLNEAECLFIRQSWDQRIKEMLDLKRQRDEAIAAERRSSRLARSNANAFKAVQLEQSNPTAALRMAEANYRLYPESEAAASIFRQLISDEQSVKCRMTFQGVHERELTYVAISEDQQRFLTLGLEGKAVIWNLDGTHELLFHEEDANPTSIHFTPDGRHVISCSRTGIAKLWNLESKEAEVIAELQEQTIYCSALSPDAQCLVMGSLEGTIHCWDFGQEKPRHIEISPDLGRVFAVAFAPDSRTFIAGFDGGATDAIEYDLQGEIVQRYSGHESRMRTLAFSPDGQWVATVAMREPVRLWNRQGELINTLEQETEDVQGLFFAPDSRHFIACSADKSARLRDLNGKVVKTFRGHSSMVHRAAFSPDGTLLLTGSVDETAKLWDLRGSEVLSVKADKGLVTASLSPAGDLITAASREDEILRWDGQGEVLDPLRGHAGIVRMAKISPDGQLIASGALDGRVLIWNRDGALLHSFDLPNMNNFAYDLCFSPDSRQLLVGCKGHTAEIYDLETGAHQATFTEHKNSVTAVAMSPDGQWMLTGSNDRRVLRWNMDEEVIADMKGPELFVQTVAISPDSRHILVGYDNYQQADVNPLQLFDQSGEFLMGLDPERPEHSQVAAVAFSPDGRFILAANNADKGVRIWNRHPVTFELRYFRGHDSAVSSIVCTADGRMIMTASGDTVKLWLSIPAYLEERIEPYTLEKLKEIGLQFTEEDVEGMMEW